MAALTIEKLTDFKGPVPVRRTLPMNGTSKCFKGGIVGIDAQGNARPGALIASGFVRTMGVALATADNTNGADGDIACEVGVGIFGPFTNNGSSITAADIGAACYVVDDQTVDISSSTNTRALAGTVEQVTTRGVYVKFA